MKIIPAIILFSFLVGCKSNETAAETTRCNLGYERYPMWIDPPELRAYQRQEPYRAEDCHDLQD
jgi:hypothetical protein